MHKVGRIPFDIQNGSVMLILLSHYSAVAGGFSRKISRRKNRAAKPVANVRPAERLAKTENCLKIPR